MQLEQATGAVLASSHGERARHWRALHEIDASIGTAVTVQRMVLGNDGGTSGAGVGFARHPATGEPAPWIDFLFDAQGEAVVSGRRDAHGHDLEFTVENGKLWLLQTCSGKRTAVAAARIALDMADAGLISADKALRRTAGLDVDALAVCPPARQGVPGRVPRPRD